ncbi:unnamed protein product [Tenebrio molitor]|nr:unnamed protein product [Tenebrio molitor]
MRRDCATLLNGLECKLHEEVKSVRDLQKLVIRGLTNFSIIVSAVNSLCISHVKYNRGRHGSISLTMLLILWTNATKERFGYFKAPLSRRCINPSKGVQLLVVVNCSEQLQSMRSSNVFII